MSKHLSNAKTRKEKYDKNKKFDVLSLLYPDYGADTEGYPGGIIQISLLAAGILLTAAGICFEAKKTISMVLYLLAFGVSGFYCFINAAKNIRISRFVSESILIIVSCLICIFSGHFCAAALIMVCYQIFKFAEMKAENMQQDKIQDVLGILPETATLIVGEDHMRIKPVHIKKGDILFVEPGEIIPVDGIVTEGLSSVDLSPLIKQNKSETVNKGSKVYGGSVNVSVPLTITADCDYSESTASVICGAFSALTDTKTEDENLSVRVCNILCPVMIVLAAICGLIIPVFNGKWDAGARRAAVMLLIACPYSLPDSLILSLLSAAGMIFGNGVVIRSLKIFRKLSRVEAFVCNKTGTVSEKDYLVTGVHGSGISDDALLALLVKVESRSDHPIAEAIRKYACYEERTLPDEVMVQELQTKGIITEAGDHKVTVGNAAFLFDCGIDCDLPEGGNVAIHAAINDKYCGYITVENQLRDGNYEAIEKMRASGVKSFALFSGDLQSVVRPIASALNFDVSEAEMTEKAKAEAVEYLSGNLSQGHTIVFAGDGYHESKAAEKADVYIATSALDFVKKGNTNDVVVLSDGISSIPYALDAAGKSTRFSFITLSLHVVIRFLLLVLAVIGICPPALAGVILAGIGVASFLESVFLFRDL